MPECSLFPQGACPIDDYVRVGQDQAARDFGRCVARAVRLPPCSACVRTHSAADRLCYITPSCVQEPYFELFEAKAAVAFVAHKLAQQLPARARVYVVAFNVAGPMGIRDLCRLNGLSTDSTISCGPPALCGPAEECSTIWMEPPACAQFANISLTIVRGESTFSEATASLELELRGTFVPEWTYPFLLHVPVTNNVSWAYRSISASLKVTAVADPERSVVRVCQRSPGARCESAAGASLVSYNGGAPPVSATILAKDSDGFELRHRRGDHSDGLTPRRCGADGARRVL